MGDIVYGIRRMGDVVAGIEEIGDIVKGALCVVYASVEQNARSLSSNGGSASIRATIDSSVWVEGDPS